MWSLGAMISALVSGISIAFLKVIIPSWADAHAGYVIILFLIIISAAWGIQKDLFLIQEARNEQSSPHSFGMSTFRPNKELWILISIILCTYLTEGTMVDWSAVYMKEVVHAPETIAAWGFAMYSGCMAGGRFFGDDLIARYGGMTILAFGGKLVLAGIGLIVLSVSPWMAMPGFMLTGLGISLASPILYAAAARVPGMPPGAGLATINNFGMAAFLGGPVLIGFVAQSINLRIAFLLVVVAALIWVIQAHGVNKKKIF
jgi:MFS family permease